MRRVLLVLFILALCLILVTPAYAAPKSDLPVRSTWDMDMIDCDAVSQTGNGVYVAVLDTGLTANWRDYFSDGNIMDKLGKGFKEEIKWDEKTRTFVESGSVHDTSFIGDTGATHGTHVTSTIIGYNYYSPADAAGGYPLNPLFIRGVAQDVKIIPVKVLSDYHIGASQTDQEQHLVFGTDRAVAAGIDYATSLYQTGYKPMVITMSLGGPTKAEVIEDAIDRAIDAGVIVVASAGNEGTGGMGYPGAYSQVVSVGACGWIYEWFHPGLLAPDKASPTNRYRLWWLQDDTYGYNDIPEPTTTEQVYITDWSSRELVGQELDVLAPGSWVRGPYPDGPGFNHLPWWSNGKPRGNVGSNFYFVGGTSMAAPHVTGVVALMLEKNPKLTQYSVESTLESTALRIEPGSAKVWDLSPTQGWYDYGWESDATGSGLIQAKAALEAI